MPVNGNMSEKSPIAEIVQKMLPINGIAAEGDRLGTPFLVTVDLDADASVHSLQNPSDSDCLVAAIVDVVTGDATETMDIGIDDDGADSNDTLMDGLDIATAGVFTSFNATDQGTNGAEFVKLDKQGGTNDYLVWKATAGTDTLAGNLVFIFIPLGE